MGRPPCCDKDGIKKGPWTPEEDIILVSYIQQHGPGNWRSVPTNTGLQRCSKSCRLRWTNYLRPGIKRGNFTPHEEGMIIHLQALLGNKWAAIASYLPQRTDNDIKNYWNTHLKKKLKRFQPTSSFHHEPQNIATTNTTSSSPNNHDSNHNNHPTQPSQLSSSCYASSTENISRLLENWMKSSSTSKTRNNLDNNAHHGDYRHEMTTNSHNQYHEEVDELDDTIMSFHNLNSDNIGRTVTTTTTCDSLDNNNIINDGIIDNIDDEEEDDESNPQLSSFLEKWLLDETCSSRHDILQLPSYF